MVQSNWDVFIFYLKFLGQYLSRDLSVEKDLGMLKYNFRKCIFLIEVKDGLVCVGDENIFSMF